MHPSSDLNPAENECGELKRTSTNSEGSAEILDEGMVSDLLSGFASPEICHTARHSRRLRVFNTSQSVQPRKPSKTLPPKSPDPQGGSICKGFLVLHKVSSILYCQESLNISISQNILTATKYPLAVLWSGCGLTELSYTRLGKVQNIPVPREGTLLQGMQCNANDNSTAALNGSTLSTVVATTADSTKSTVPLTSLKSTTQAPTTKATSPAQTGPSSTVAYQDPANNTTSQNVLVTTQITTIQPTTPNAGTTLTTFNNSPQTSPTTLIATDPNQTELPTTESDSKSTASQSLGTTKAQTTTASIIPGQRIDEDITTNTPEEIFNYSFDPSNSTEYSFDPSNSTEKNNVRQTCKTLGQKMKGNCTVTVEIHDKRLIATVTIDGEGNADQKIPPDNYKPIEPVSGVTDSDNFQKEDVIVVRITRHVDQHLTEELQTVENGYHDNPTLEVMEVQPEMQEKKLTMNREFNDSWIVPIDNLLKEDIPDEEDTHL
ncbi:podocalyxin-like [Cyprinus carpio]|uniref:Podocalyxin n=1 Tax=Cyprinus carpio TaxID=7962 RepID=A0A9Q9W836_CYPCA|nr:podocalyxin-like [Cyprinus carpio]